jgi:hypothetical protein
VPPSAAATFAAAVVLTVGQPPAAGAFTSVSHPQDVPIAVQEDTVRTWIPCRRTEPDCVSKKLVATAMEAGQQIDVDGRLDDEMWRAAVFTSDFTQRQPDEGQPASERTEVAFVYSNNALYVGARMFTKDPSSIRAILSRRDEGGDSERIIILLDSYQNRRTHYGFAVTAAGTRVDWYVSSDDEGYGNRDFSFNPVWEAAAVIDSLGWTAEMEIPLSQIRFNRREENAFGLNINRYIPQKSEDAYWIAVPTQESGWTSWFGDLVGMYGLKARRPVELSPYAAAEATLTSATLVDPADPFRGEQELEGRVGADLKMGVGPSLTLDATFNPDFGQVEADPAVVNLSAFPVFFEEKRPFFVEGKELLEAGGLFYSRRIGAPPRGRPAADFVDMPGNTTILAAGKLTGRTPGGLSVGALGAVTSEESAAIYDSASNTFGKARVEPSAGWAVLSLQQELGVEGSTVGGSFTGVRRSFGDQDVLALRMNREAYAGLVDWNLRIEGGVYELRGLAGGSYIAGTAPAIRRVQEFSSHYFQRPDADYLTYDTTRTSLSGYAAELQFERTSARHWLWEVEARAHSPGLDINDAGQLRKADRIEGMGSIRYRETIPGTTFRSYSIQLEGGGSWNYGWVRQPSDFELGADFTLLNFWSFGAEISYQPRAQSDVLTRGGPLMGTGASWGARLDLRSDRRRLTTFGIDGAYYRDEFGGWVTRFDGEVEIRPGGAFQISVSPEYQREYESRQYVGRFDGGSEATFGSRYVFAFLDYSEISARFRVNYAFTPDLSLDLYAEPFSAAGTYSRFGELSAAKSRDLRVYGTDGTTISESTGPAPREITVTDGADTFSFEREDFEALSFRSNVVLRWEWRRGSTLYLVWQMNRSSEVPVTEPNPVAPGDAWRSLGEPGQSFIAIKASYWLPI